MTVRSARIEAMKSVKCAGGMAYRSAVSASASTTGSAAGRWPVSARRSSASRRVRAAARSWGVVPDRVSSTMSSARRANPYRACTAGLRSAGSRRVARK
ncbi:hypothetical protein SVIOM342S_03519 [Streptomyces violaceorubidus]